MFAGRNVYEKGENCENYLLRKILPIKFVSDSLKIIPQTIICLAPFFDKTYPPPPPPTPHLKFLCMSEHFIKFEREFVYYIDMTFHRLGYRIFVLIY